METHLDPVGNNDDLYRVMLDGRRIGFVSKNMTLGPPGVWQYARSHDDRPRGALQTPEQAADQLAANYLQRKKKP